MRTRRMQDKAAVRDKLAAIAGCEPGELVITRNTTESLDTVINGYDWKPGDEAVMATQDYNHMLAQFTLVSRRAWNGRSARVGSVRSENRRRDRAGTPAITPKTRLLMVCHMINITGQILLQKIADMAHARGVDVMVDGAHAFAHFDYKIPDKAMPTTTGRRFTSG